MTADEFNALRKDAINLLQRSREYEDLTVLMLLDQVRETIVTGMISRRYIMMESTDLAGMSNAELLTITDPILSEALKEAVARGITLDQEDRAEVEIADRMRKEAQFAHDFPECAEAKAKALEGLEDLGAADMAPSELLKAVDEGNEIWNSNYVHQDALNSFLGLDLFSDVRAEGPRHVLINDRKTPVVDLGDGSWRRHLPQAADRKDKARGFESHTIKPNEKC